MTTGHIKYQILKELRKWKKGKEILKTLARYKITINDINVVVEKSRTLKYHFENWKTYKYCNVCWSLKEYTSDNYYKYTGRINLLKPTCIECCKLIATNTYKLKTREQREKEKMTRQKRRGINKDVLLLKRRRKNKTPEKIEELRKRDRLYYKKNKQRIKFNFLKRQWTKNKE